MVFVLIFNKFVIKIIKLHLNRFFGITEKDIDETNNIKYSNDKKR